MCFKETASYTDEQNSSGISADPYRVFNCDNTMYSYTDNNEKPYVPI
jgi:hypothetical protein